VIHDSISATFIQDLEGGCVQVSPASSVKVVYISKGKHHIELADTEAELWHSYAAFFCR
jgi:hypothetical protein